MTEPNNDWHDAHLKAALKHAPDNHAQVSELTRKQILNYANNAVKKQPSKLNRFKSWLFKNHFASSQWAGLTGVTAVLLVAVLFWRQHPEETVWISATPKDISENSPASAKAPTKIQAEVSQNAASADSLAPSAPDNPQNDSTFQPAPIAAKSPLAKQQRLEDKKLDSLASKNIPSAEYSANRLQGQLHDAPVKSSREELTQPIINQQDQAKIATAQAPVEAAAAPAPMAITQPDFADTTGEAIGKEKLIKQGVADKKMESTPLNVNAEQSHTEALKQRMGQLSSLDSTNLSNALTEQGGQAIAQQDIEAGTFRLLKVKAQKNVSKQEAQACKPLRLADKVDAETGYKIETLTVCNDADALIKATEDYNQIMKSWHLMHKN